MIFVKNVSFVSRDSVQKNFAKYLHENPSVQRSVSSFISYLAAVSSLKPHMVTGPAAIVAPEGARIASWVPTYLVIDGPLGRVLREPDSPLNIVLRSQYNDFPVLCEARDLFNSQVFNDVRNAVGHWSFSLEVHNIQEANLVCYDYPSGKQTIKISREIAEALHFVSFTIIFSLDKYIFSSVAKKEGD